MVLTPYGIVATSYVQASQAGGRVLEQGGSAIDAGIAANAVLGVAEPMMNGRGGDRVLTLGLIPLWFRSLCVAADLASRKDMNMIFSCRTYSGIRWGRAVQAPAPRSPA